MSETRLSWSEKLAARLLSRAQAGRLTVTFSRGDVLVFEGTQPGPEAALILKSPATMRNLLTGGANGFAEAYLDADWDTPDLPALLSWGAANDDAMRLTSGGTILLRMADRIRHLFNNNSKTGSRKNIAYHYDLGNEFYKKWLDPSMTYSSAVFEREDEDLQDAQTRKYRQLAEALEITPGMDVLEVGCGWGGFAEVAARDFGANVTAITISQEQFDFATQRIEKAGLTDQVTVKFCDYRDIEGQFDRIASIEMIEAVGLKHLPTYFGVLRDRLKPTGLAGIQAITIEESRFDTYRKSVDFIQKYIFPGGFLPAVSYFHNVAGQAGLKVKREMFFGQSYATTLARWRDRFNEAWAEIHKEQEFDERFRRMWLYYLAYCEVGFARGRTDVGQIILMRDEQPLV
ncbi:MAG: cyclopropane-fatty-acyl-phospholipid synthase family protein [Alphaproteobacteria bacterium]